MPEWYLLIALLGVLSLLSYFWAPLTLCVPLLALAVGAPLVQASLCVSRVYFTHAPVSRTCRMKLRLLIACLHVLQPLARLCGRLRHGLTVCRQRTVAGLALPRPWLANIWCARCLPVDERLLSVEANLREQGVVALRGGEFDQWDLEVRRSLLGAARMFVGVEYHGDGRQLLRIRSWPRCPAAGLTLTLLFAALSLGAAIDQAWQAFYVLSTVAVLLTLLTAHECAAATAGFLNAVRKLEREEKRLEGD
jgi:hypothetical protein